MSSAAEGEPATGDSSEAVTLAGLPCELYWQVLPVRWSAKDGKQLTIEAGPRTDMFVDPQGSEPTLNAARLLGPIEGDFRLSAMVAVGFAGTFDAGVLMIHGDDRNWAKLCFEYSPLGQPMVVSVATRGVSDDANSMPIDAKTVWLLVARIGSAFAFHASTNGTTWQFVRHFALDSGEAPQVGFVGQSPTGEGCTVTFEDIRFEPRRLTDLRNGE
jgi:regulation of enolase protein 1 (concanavalin A-like superfamily)